MANAVEILINAKDNASKVMGKVEGRVDKLNNTLRKMRPALLVGTAALGALGVAGIKAASDLEEAQNMATEVFKDAIPAINKFADETAIAYGLSNRAAFEYSGTLGGILKATGMTEEASAGMSIQMLKLAGDMASFKNIDVETALNKIRAGLVGETEPLKQVGVLMNEAIIKQRAYSMGLVEVGGALTEAQKVQARYAELMSQTNDMQGDAIRTSDTFAGAIREFKAGFEDAKSEIGRFFLPVATKAVDKVRDSVIAFGEMSPASQKAVVGIGGITAGFFALGAALPTLTNVVTILKGLKVVALGAKAALVGAGLGITVGAVGILAAAAVNWALIVKTQKEGVAETEKLRAEAVKLGIVNASTIKDYNELARLVTAVKIGDLSKSAEDLLESSQEIASEFEKIVIHSMAFKDNLEAHVELAEEFRQIQQQTKQAEEQAAGGAMLKGEGPRDTSRGKWRQGGAAATWWAGARKGGASAGEQAIFDAAHQFPVGMFKDMQKEGPIGLPPGIDHRTGGSIDAPTGDVYVNLNGRSVDAAVGEGISGEQQTRSG